MDVSAISELYTNLQDFSPDLSPSLLYQYWKDTGVRLMNGDPDIYIGDGAAELDSDGGIALSTPE